jgi:hypothetical protein
MNYSLLKSRTFWTLVLMFLIGGGNALVPVLPSGLQATAMGLLACLAAYYHVTPSQQYNTSNIDTQN